MTARTRTCPRCHGAGSIDCTDSDGNQVDEPCCLCDETGFVEREEVWA